MRSKYQRVDSVATDAGGTAKTGGYTLASKVATLRLDAVVIPPEVLRLLTEEEIALVTEQVIEPAKLAAHERTVQMALELAEQEARLTDPNTALHCALQNLNEGLMHIDLSDRLPETEGVTLVVERCLEVALRGASKGSDVLASTSEVFEVLAHAIKVVSIHVSSDSVPAAERVTRENPFSGAWKEVWQAFEQLRSAMQDKRFAQTRGSK
jgi:hypothetical protein